jgi:iron complex transport system substrate-binding protein
MIFEEVIYIESKKEKVRDFGSDLEEEIPIWERTPISLIDIRHHTIRGEKDTVYYRMPASTFLYTIGRKAKVILNDISYQTEHFGLFHGGKGTVLHICPDCECFEYYMVLYKPDPSISYNHKLIKLLSETNPFRQQFGFVPENPIFFSEQLRKMHEKWKGPTPLNRFYGKAAFYQFVYEIYEELNQRHIHIFEPDIIDMAMRYLDTHYGEKISIQEMCVILGISYSHLHRTFKQKTNQSPQEYLIKIRLSKAMDLLVNSKFSIRHIAEYCGFQDERNLQRAFAGKIGISPKCYRENMSLQMRDSDIENLISFPYNGDVEVSYNELKGKGVPFMLKQITNRTIAAALLGMLLLTACSFAPAKNSNSDSPASASNQTVNTQDGNQKEETKIFSTIKGDVEIPVNPKRIVVQYLTGDLVALKTIPIGITDVHEGAAYEQEVKNSTVLGQWEFEPEEVMALEPDLIILASDTQYDTIKKIAPTVVVPYGTMSTAERLEFMGELLNKSEEAIAAVTEYESAISAGKEKLADAGLSTISVSAMQVTGEGISVAGNKHALGAVLYDELGLKAPESVQTEIIDADEYWAAPSMETLSDYCGDYVFHLGEIPESIKENEVWKSIPAVKDNRVLVMDTSLTYYTDISSTIAMINNVVDQLVNTSPE